MTPTETEERFVVLETKVGEIDEKLDEVLAFDAGIRGALGTSPDAATGSEGSGMRKQLAYLYEAEIKRKELRGRRIAALLLGTKISAVLIAMGGLVLAITKVFI